ncbi:MAG: peptide ABC transporter permease [Planctomycetaceae bacterium]|nr:peptide ABC transporter permease [Planctomycetaceae bacterium]
MRFKPTQLGTPHQRVWLRLRRSTSAKIGAVVVVFFVGMAAAADWVAPYGPQEHDAVVGAHADPSAKHWLGVDENEKDVLSRVMYGAKLSLFAGFVSIAMAVILGSTAGTLAGYFGGWIDALIMRGIDIALAFPSILIALLVATAYRPGWAAVILAVGLINVPVFARQVRVTVLTLRELDYVLASKALGANSLQVLSQAILPGIINPVVVLATLGLGAAILEVAGLSFLGVGGDPTEPEWGSMLAQAKDHLTVSIWPAVGPGVAISLAILGFNLLGDGLRDALDPRLNEAS